MATAAAPATSRWKGYLLDPPPPYFGVVAARVLNAIPLVIALALLVLATIAALCGDGDRATLLNVIGVIAAGALCHACGLAWARTHPHRSASAFWVGIAPLFADSPVSLWVLACSALSAALHGRGAMIGRLLLALAILAIVLARVVDWIPRPA